MILTPNVKRLVLERASQLMMERSKPYPQHEHGAACAVASRLAENNGANLIADLRESHEWTEKAISAVRKASDPNPYRDSTDEQIATVLMERIDARKAS